MERLLLWLCGCGVMMRKFIIILILLFFCFGFSSPHHRIIARKNTVVAYCDGVSWPILSNPSFTIDFDNTTDTRKSCFTNEEQGVLTNGATIVSPAVATPTGGSYEGNGVSGGNALLIDGNDEHIIFNNDGSYFSSTSGEISFLVNLMGDNNSSDFLVGIYHADTTDEFNIIITEFGWLTIQWEGSNETLKAINLVDMDPYGYGKWFKVQVRWDTGLGDNSLCGRYKVETTVGNGWAADFTSWNCDHDITAFATEPGTSDIGFGMLDWQFDGDANNVDIYIDDIEIKSSTSW